MPQVGEEGQPGRARGTRRLLFAGEELLTKELNKLEKQRHQLEEEVEPEQQPTAPSTMKHLTVKILQHFYAKADRHHGLPGGGGP